MGIGGWIVIAVVALLVVWFVFTYNRLVTARNRTQEAWSELDVELNRRHDLIPNLVNTVQGYVGHERGTLEAVTNARAAAVAAGATGDPAKIGQAENMLSQSLRSLFAVSENYPELKAITAFTNLQEALTATEDKIEFSRRFYNGNVRDYNIKLQTLPTSPTAGVRLLGTPDPELSTGAGSLPIRGKPRCVRRHRPGISRLDVQLVVDAQ